MTIPKTKSKKKSFKITYLICGSFIFILLVVFIYNKKTNVLISKNNVESQSIVIKSEKEDLKFSNTSNEKSDINENTINSDLQSSSNSENNSSKTEINGLVAYYPFTGNAGDSSGNGNHGVVNGATLTTDRYGNANKAYKFNGNSNILIRNLHNLSYKPITYSGWITISKWITPTANYTQKVIIGRDISGSQSQGSVSLATYKNYFVDQLFYYGGAPATPDLPISNTTLQLNHWIFFTFTIDVSGNFNWYINGKLTNQGKVSNSYTDDITFYIGSGNNRDYWDSNIDDIRIYNRVLTALEINYIYSH